MLVCWAMPGIPVCHLIKFCIGVFGHIVNFVDTFKLDKPHLRRKTCQSTDVEDITDCVVFHIWEHDIKVNITYRSRSMIPKIIGCLKWGIIDTYDSSLRRWLLHWTISTMDVAVGLEPSSGWCWTQSEQLRGGQDDPMAVASLNCLVINNVTSRTVLLTQPVLPGWQLQQQPSFLLLRYSWRWVWLTGTIVPIHI